MSKGELASIIDKRLMVIMMVQSNLESFKPLLWEEKKNARKKKPQWNVLTLEEKRNTLVTIILKANF